MLYFNSTNGFHPIIKLPVRFPLSDFFEGMAAIGVNRTEVLGLSNMEIATADSDPDMLIREQPVYTRPILPG